MRFIRQKECAMTRWSQPVIVFAHLLVGLVATNLSLSNPASAQQQPAQPAQQQPAQQLSTTTCSTTTCSTTTCSTTNRSVKAAQPIAQQVAAPGKLAPGAEMSPNSFRCCKRSILTCHPKRRSSRSKAKSSFMDRPAWMRWHTSGPTASTSFIRIQKSRSLRRDLTKRLKR